MIKLRPYKNCDAQYIVSWITDEYAFRQWSVDRYNHYPITASDMNLYYEKDKDNANIWGMTAFDETGVIGHFTMRFPNDNQDELRLGFVIVDNLQRKKGYGKEMVSLAVQYAFEFIKVQKVSLGVFQNNIAAIRCYESCGFKEITTDQVESYLCMGERWNCIEMALKK